MSAVCVLTPIVVASWPALSAAIMGAAASMGFSVQAAGAPAEKAAKRRVETNIPNSEILAEELQRGQRIVVQRGDITIEFGQDLRGACTVCVTGKNHSDAALRKIGDDVAGRVVQQFAYHKLMTELKSRNYTVLSENVLADESVQVRIQL
jgi:hypothetical protein